MLCLVLLGEGFSRAPSQGCHREINPALIPCPIFFFCGAKLGSGARNRTKLKLPRRGENIAMVSFNLDRFSRPAACTDRWEQGGSVPTTFN